MLGASFLFALIASGTAFAAVPANLTTQIPADTTAPVQIRLAYASSTGMTVSWNTYSQLSNPYVNYGLNASSLNFTATSNTSVTYATSLTWNNHVTISGLTPNTKYFYRPQFSNTTYNFVTSRAAGDMTPYITNVVVDLGLIGPNGLSTVGKASIHPLGVNDSTTISTMESKMNEFDLIWHPGDIAYADYWLKEEIGGAIPNTSYAEGVVVYETLLNQFYDEMSALSAYKPYMVGPGNHEANCDNGGTTDTRTNTTVTSSICMPGQTNFTGFINHFRMPGKLSGGTGNFWFSFDHGMTHYIQLNSETDLGHGYIAQDAPNGPEGLDSGPFNTTMDAQTTWLEADLKAVNRTKTPWVVAAAHRPWYLSHANASGTICWSCKDVFEPLLYKYGVDLVMHGHSHVYQRSAPMYDSQVDPNELNNPKFPWYIVNGAGGHWNGLDALQYPLYNYSRKAFDTAYGYSRLTFHNATHLTHDFVASANGTVLDSATLFKNRTTTAAATSSSTTSGADLSVVSRSTVAAAGVLALAVPLFL